MVSCICWLSYFSILHSQDARLHWQCLLPLVNRHGREYQIPLNSQAKALSVPSRYAAGVHVIHDHTYLEAAWKLFVGAQNKIYFVDKVENNPTLINNHPAWASGMWFLYRAISMTDNRNRVDPWDGFPATYGCHYQLILCCEQLFLWCLTRDT